ncbi:GWxTD domain-containing protein [Rubrivirga sp. IMCC43871]|uniref:GWxTD domain-containing protein n=1 Tax=Rubrivirga sp. IMCC43871 TaxID=3391575 RepID=UPI0039902C80
MRPVVLAFALALSAAAQPDAGALLAAGDTTAAVEAVRAGFEARPDDAALRSVALRLDLAGRSRTVQRLPRPLRQRHVVARARELLALAPTDTVALRVLASDATWTALGWHDRVTLGHISSPYGAFVSAEEVRARQAYSQVRTEQRRAMAPDLDRSERAAEAHLEAVGYLDTWLGADPSAPEAYRLAATLAVLTREWAGLARLAARFGAASDDPRADLYAGLAAYRLGDAAASEAAFARAVAGLSEAEAARLTDVRALLTTDRRAAYDAAPDAVADSFWTTTDPRLLSEANERRAEHRARVVEADLMFGRSADNLFAPVAQRGAETSQGQVWVRYGRPAETVRFLADENAVQIYGERDNRFAIWDYPDFQFVFDDPSSSGVYRTYSPPASAFGSTSSAARDDFVAQDARMQRDDPQRTQDAPETALDVPMLASRFRAPGGGTDVIVGWGVPLDSVAAPVRTGAFAVARGAVVDRAVAERMGLGSGRITRAGGAAVWAEGAAVRVAGSGEVRAEVEGDGGRAHGAASVPVEPLPGGFGVSDLLLALSVDDDGGGPVVRDGLGIVPAPRAAFPTTDPVYVVLEAYGLGLEDGRTRYTVEATLRPQARRGGLLGRLFGRGRGPGVSVRTEGAGSRADETLSFFVDVRQQPAGAYTLRVEVRDETTGATAAAERAVTLE